MSPDKLNKSVSQDGTPRRGSGDKNEQYQSTAPNKVVNASVYNNHNNRFTYEIDESVPKKPLQQSHSAFNILKRSNQLGLENGSTSSKENMQRLHDLQSGDSWS